MMAHKTTRFCLGKRDVHFHQHFPFSDGGGGGQAFGRYSSAARYVGTYGDDAGQAHGFILRWGNLILSTYPPVNELVKGDKR